MIEKVSDLLVKEFKNGKLTLETKDWRELLDFFINLQEYPGYIWRGQSNVTWGLESSFDRLFYTITPEEEIEHLPLEALKRKMKYLANDHLKQFTFSTRGKLSFDAAQLKTENEWWALAQHVGMATPLLDWSTSPFVALYFAVKGHLNADQKKERNKRKKIQCALWAIVQIKDLAKQKRKLLKEETTSNDTSISAQLAYTFSPLQQHNNRLISQSALFTRSPFGVTIEEWMIRTCTEIFPKYKTNYVNEKKVLLIKVEITMTRKEVHDCLRFLNQANINDATLFPDLHGVAMLCNTTLQVKNYKNYLPYCPEDPLKKTK